MASTSYRDSLDNFIAATEWEVSSPRAHANMKLALDYFVSRVPASHLDQPETSPTALAFRPADHPWTRLMGWMQAINFEQRVDPQTVIAPEEPLLAFRSRIATAENHRFGNFYARNPDGNRLGQPHSAKVHAIPGRAGIPSTQNKPTRYTARRRFTCLETTAGDAFLSWIDPKQYEPSYARGGIRQLFIWEAQMVLTPEFD